MRQPLTVEPHNILLVLLVVNHLRPLDNLTIRDVRIRLWREDMAHSFPRDKVAAAVAVDADETKVAIVSSVRSTSTITLGVQREAIENLPPTVSQPSLILAEPIPIIVVRAGTLENRTAMSLDQSARGVGHVEFRVESCFRCFRQRRANGQGREGHLDKVRSDHYRCWSRAAVVVGQGFAAKTQHEESAWT